jgi:hypothetical protein
MCDLRFLCKKMAEHGVHNIIHVFQVGYYKSTNTGTAAGTKVQILTQVNLFQEAQKCMENEEVLKFTALLVQKYKYLRSTNTDT